MDRDIGVDYPISAAAVKDMLVLVRGGVVIDRSLTCLRKQMRIVAEVRPQMPISNDLDTVLSFPHSSIFDAIDIVIEPSDHEH